MPWSSQLRSVPPAPISISSECAPRHSTDNRSPAPGDPKSLHRTHRGSDTGVQLPGRIATLDHFLEHLPVPERVHGPPKSFVPVGHELSTVDETLEGLHDQFIAFLNVVEYFLPEDEKSAIDPYLGTHGWRSFGEQRPSRRNRRDER